MRDETDPLRDLGKQLPYDRPDPARRDAVRSSLLIAASEGRRPGASNRWLLVGGGFAAGALAAAAVALLVLRPADPSPTEWTHTRIGQSTDAKTLYTRDTPTANGTERVIRVAAGSYSFEVPAGRKTENVRVQTGDAEVEGTGMYQIVVAADALASVAVSTGTATVRVNGRQQAVFLSAGETWRPSVVTADLDVALPNPDAASNRAAALPAASPSPSPSAESPAPLPSSPAASPPAASPSPSPPAASPSPSPPAASPSRTPISSRVVASSPASPSASAASSRTTNTTPPTAPSPSPRTAITAVVAEPTPSVVAEPTPPAVTSPTESAFRAGYALLRADRYAAAALELGKAADGDGPLAADARYFQAVALTKDGRSADAERALVQFIDRASTSVRRGRAVVMLARILAARGESASARAWFEDALRDSDASVVAAARAGLATL